MFQPSLHGDVVSKSCRRGPGRSSFSHTLGRFVSPIPHNSARSDPGYFHRQETTSGVERDEVVDAPCVWWSSKTWHSLDQTNIRCTHGDAGYQGCVGYCGLGSLGEFTPGMESDFTPKHLWTCLDWRIKGHAWTHLTGVM